MLRKNIEQLNSISNDEANNLALSLVPKIRELRSKTDNTNTNISDDILNLIHKAKLFRYVQPKQWGGLELNLDRKSVV